MQREVGSNFWLDPNQSMEDVGNFSLKSFGIDGSDYVLLSTGRSGLSLVLDTIAQRYPKRNRRALLPPFTCHTVIEPFLDAGYEVGYYPVDETLMTSTEWIEDAARKNHPTVVLFHRYFGFETLPEMEGILSIFRSQGIVVIEDRTQCLYSEIPPMQVDFWNGSLRKWAGLPDGGFAICREGVLSQHPQQWDVALEQKKVKASYAKYRYLFEGEGEKTAFLQLYREAEQLLNEESGLYAISPTALAVQGTLNLAELKRRRRQNYQVLLDRLGSCKGIRPLFSVLPDGVVPLYFPMVVSQNRAGLQKHLAGHDIYAPIIWPRPAVLPSVCSAAETLYQEMLCIPIDQRYGMNDMAWIADVILSYVQ